MIIKQPEYKVVQRMEQVFFECVIKYDATLIPTIIWLKENDELPDDGRYVFLTRAPLFCKLIKHQQGDLIQISRYNLIIYPVADKVLLFF